MTTSANDPKDVIRRHALAARRSMSPAERQIASFAVFDRLMREPHLRRAARIAAYLPLPSEVGTWPFIERAQRMKKRIFVPTTKKNRTLSFREFDSTSNLIVNEFGIVEPDSGVSIDARQLDIVLVPLVAFDDNANRIGMGGGFYDRSFSFLRNRRFFRKPKLIGLAFDCQKVEQIPASPWDIQLFQIITESSTVPV